MRRLPEVETELRRLGADFRTVQTLDAGHARELAAEAGRNGETVVSVGGDGLLRPLAAALRDTDGALAVVPAGPRQRLRARAGRARGPPGGGPDRGPGHASG